MNSKTECFVSYRNCLSLLVMLLLPLVLYAEDSMSNQRLFFTDQQRQLINLTSAGNAQNKVTVPMPQIENPQPPTRENPRSVMESEATPKVTQNMTLFINGYVAGRARIQVVINGMPCQAIPVIESIEIGALNPIDCPHLSHFPYTLLLNQQAGQVVVQLDKLTKATLTQGDLF